MGEIVYKELSYRVVGLLFDVYNEIGAGQVESVYQKAMAVALKKAGIIFREQVYYKIECFGERVGHGFMDFLIEDKLVLEIKRSAHFSKKDFNQVKNYLKQSKLKLGILATFANKSVKFSRVLNLFNI